MMSVQATEVRHIRRHRHRSQAQRPAAAYGYTTGILSARESKRATRHSVACRFIAARSHSNHDGLATLRRRFPDERSGLCLPVPVMARDMQVPEPVEHWNALSGHGHGGHTRCVTRPISNAMSTISTSIRPSTARSGNRPPGCARRCMRPLNGESSALTGGSVNEGASRGARQRRMVLGFVPQPNLRLVRLLDDCRRRSFPQWHFSLRQSLRRSMA
ncbi:hypothetical protein CAP2UW1_0450 [Candidatus Accumulibacter phosphatis]|jgi:hypothetical protein|uniref:Uncharacterized protein n=1 Tax=Accumulibacter regalis TaxID=522306 RepID=C7RKX9_ACCRE